MFSGCPPFFEDLNLTVLRDEKTITEARKHGMDVRQSFDGTNFIYGLSGAAAKWRLAHASRGIDFSDYVTTTQNTYSSQLLVTLAFVAIEAYGRTQKKKWYQMNEFSEFCGSQKASDIREKIGSAALTELSKKMTRNTLKKKILSFDEGDDSEVLAVASGLRNAFAHGLLGARQKFYKPSLSLKDLMLDFIKEDCDRKVKYIGSV